MSDEERSGRALSIVIADDDDLLRDGLWALLSCMPGITPLAWAANGVEAVAAVERHSPDVVLMDVDMPMLDGCEATAIIVSKFPKTRVLALTALDNRESAAAMLAAGAVGYLTKALRRGLLEASIREAALGRGVISSSLPATIAPPPSKNVPDLTESERAVVALLAQGLTNDEIAQALFMATATVKKRVSALQRKLQATNRVTIAVRATQLGLVAPDVSPDRESSSTRSRRAD